MRPSPTVKMLVHVVVDIRLATKAPVTATFCACGTMTAALPRNARGSAGAPTAAGRAVDGPAAGTLVPRKLADGRQEAPRREAQFGSTRAVE